MKLFIKFFFVIVTALLLIFSGCKQQKPKNRNPFQKPVIKDKEVSTYRLTMANGVRGKAVFKVEKDKEKPYGFILTNTGLIPSMLDSVAVSRVKYDMSPISTNVKIKNPGGIFKLVAKYRGNKLIISNGRSNTSQIIKITQPTYDFGEFLILLRSLNFKPGAKYTVNEAWPSFGQVFKSKIIVQGIENIKVPAGQFLTYYVTHTFGQPQSGNSQAVYRSWYEQAYPHRLIRHDNGNVIYELMPENDSSRRSL